jgi:membrane protein implicated in regulation of membrane protease activity
MDYGAAEPRGEDKFQLILSQIGSIRSRLNALALQKGLFAPLTFILCAIVLILAAAFAFGPLAFLLLAAAVTVVAIAGVVRTARAAWQMRTSDERAAHLADERAALKGRLTTMVDGGRLEQRSALWPYLIEDTLALRDEFAAARIEPRRVSRWLWAAIASCAVAAVAMRVAYGVRISRLTTNNHIASVPGEPTVDLGDLDIRPADPSVERIIALPVLRNPARFIRLPAG